MGNNASHLGIQVDRPAAEWGGRLDGEGAEHLRWHQHVNSDRFAPSEEHSTSRPVALLGFASDAGVLRNQGRTGAASGPQALRAALSSLAIHQPRAVHDAGDIVVLGDELESGQVRLAQAVSGLLNAGTMPVVLGGGHETAYGSFSGLFDHFREHPDTRIGILNLDAHFDLRSAPRRSSGTPFKDIANDMQAAGRDFRYAVIGISEPNNTRVLFDQAHALGVRYLVDEQCGAGNLEAVIEFVREFLGSVDQLYLTIDLDVLPAATAPGVSAPAAYGVPLEVIHAVCRYVADSGKLGLVDVVELNPSFDIDARTARTAARLINTLIGV
ncbi:MULTISPECIES: formimidoylglutamase [Glutamicibacter]|jgi:formiminoglutamase|uniref:Formimidoylglutamase n=2 Tax=Glutamicibacter TaxID=1742989 RepID=A0ABV9MKD8_9MICC|nr:formimidoylglutamase [Glutamicibacter ardleyensis]GGJ47356.1 formimidoylglutamase [Glutamicibacter ardleyensis]HBV09283.1 formimidoylglutamase [Micrococcaceae bacterium]